MTKSFEITKSDTLLIAFSAGVDSVVLAHLCLAAGLKIALAHCNFRLRGEESHTDERFSKEWAKTHNIRLHYISFDTKKEIEKTHKSVQMVARDLRYRWFEALLDLESYDYLLTAHHADDNLETFIMNLSRGTGISGLTGIPERKGKIVRPLLPFSKAELITYAKSNKLTWREDHSNTEMVYDRNQVRHNIVPALKSFNPNILDSLATTLSHLNESKQLLESTKTRLQATLFQAYNDVVRISIVELQKLHPMQAYLYLLFNEFGFTDWLAIEHLISGESGKEITSKSHRLLKDRQYILLKEAETSDIPESYSIHPLQKGLLEPIVLHFVKVSSLDGFKPNVIYVDNEKLKYPLKLRKWKNGDYFYPFGMKGKKKLSKYFKDEKVDGFAKENQWLLCSDDDIVWVVGKRADNRFKVSKETSEIVKIIWSQ